MEIQKYLAFCGELTIQASSVKLSGSEVMNFRSLVAVSMELRPQAATSVVNLILWSQTAAKQGKTRKSLNSNLPNCALSSEM